MSTLGTLYGLGVGPGDPELLTIKAARVLGSVAAVFAASSSKNDYSIAEAIIGPHLPPGTSVTRLPFPMTRDQATLDAAWAANATAMAVVLAAGRDAAFVTLGDPLLYSTFGYVLPLLRSRLPELPVVIVPGVTSFQAAAARTGDVLVESGENLLIASGVDEDGRLRRALETADNAVILKAYRNFPRLRTLLADMGLEDKTTFVTRLGHDGEAVERDLRNAPEKPHYLSLCLVKRGS
ncbi:precorrin-2 C20-methyltransferase [Solidesulfovibrio carbinoliphilus subsp. oakridgensis]|uniref:Precorrin-2 C20-methyltransferase n=1 Tax=Solidesulfovibrio carbinoliphilus subsp. oakridgensis TaxID=694327 RepID=G7QD07_9BACT|nr:precorrin-2 C(20)-methyltransferase [Solidesulfovibrio carbinoliphilus]EHJ46313.1 precorrin-2 C20-methyltransferase [Solidesulfovibrio carbinoliphilus subsp. oakridgensis]